MSDNFLPGYLLRRGLSSERSRLAKFVQLAYCELYPDRHFSHLADTVDLYFSTQTPLWWVDESEPQPSNREPVACLWMGNALDPSDGERHAHVFLVYVAPPHRRRGIASALMRHAEAWARQRGDRQIGLQVFADNFPALSLYKSQGYQPISVWMGKPL
jgi:ribosomal protein S18 acetylase RimI-like enzyme